MPERLDRVAVTLAQRDVTISWDARQALMTRLYDANIKAGMMTFGESSDGLLRSFEAVGATRPVELTEAQRSLLLRVLVRWSEEDVWSLTADGQMPAEVVILCDALKADLRGRE